MPRVPQSTPGTEARCVEYGTKKDKKSVHKDIPKVIFCQRHLKLDHDDENDVGGENAGDVAEEPSALVSVQRRISQTIHTNNESKKYECA